MQLRKSLNSILNFLPLLIWALMWFCVILKIKASKYWMFRVWIFYDISLKWFLEKQRHHSLFYKTLKHAFLRKITPEFYKSCAMERILGSERWEERSNFHSAYMICHCSSEPLCSAEYLRKEMDAAVKVILLKTEVRVNKWVKVDINSSHFTKDSAMMDYRMNCHKLASFSKV